MPRYTPDPTKVQAGIPVLPKDEYEFKIGEPKAFAGQNREGKENYGVRYQLTVSGGKQDGKRIPITLYMHSDGAAAMAKRFQMAALGYGKTSEEESRFDSEQADQDWGFDTDSGICGDGWKQLTGQRVRGMLDVKMDDKGNEQQNFDQWLPIQ